MPCFNVLRTLCQSTNGTFINGQSYKHSRQILCHNDLIGIGKTTSKRAANLPHVYTFCLKYCDDIDIETIELNDNDWYDADTKCDVKNVLSIGVKATAAANTVITIDSDSEPESEFNCIAAADAYDTDNDDNFDYDHIGNSPSMDNAQTETMQQREHVVAELPPPVWCESTQMEIKQELVDLSYSYERDAYRERFGTPSPPPDAIVELSDDSDVLMDDEMPTSRRDHAHLAAEQSLGSKRMRGAYYPPYESHCSSSTAETSAMNDPQPDVPEKRPKKTYVKYTANTHGLQLAEDFMAMVKGKPPPEDTNEVMTRWKRTQRKHRRSMTLKGANVKAEPETIKYTEMALEKLASLRWTAECIFLDVTRWDVTWLADGQKLPPLCGGKFNQSPVQHQFTSIGHYQKYVVTVRFETSLKCSLLISER